MKDCLLWISEHQLSFFVFKKTLHNILTRLLVLKSPVINCTMLTVAPGGPLRMSSCGNHYGEMCHFSCAIGYRMNGSSTVTCMARDNSPPGFWDNPPPICQGKEQ